MRFRPKHAAKAIEWICCAIRLPPDLFETVLWKVPGRPIIVMPLAETGPVELKIVDCYKLLLQPSLSKPPRRPDRIRVSSQSLARKLRNGLGGTIHVVCGPTPELDSVLGRENQQYEMYIPRDPLGS
jgi:hypothetical protein